VNVNRIRTLAPKLGLALGALGGAALVVLACSDELHRRTSAEQALGGGGACGVEPGKVPPADCDDSDNKCEPQPGCTIDEARCGSASTCLPIGDNKGKDVQDFRIRRLKIATPAALAGEFIQNNVVTLNIDLAEKTCGEPGKGLFTWLIEVDRKNNTIVTGGAPPSTDAIGKGFCFARFDVGATKIAPVTSKITFTGDTFALTERQKVKIPIFTDTGSVIILPITDLQVEGVKITDDGNCIGKINPVALDPSCADGADCTKWKTAGALAGFITLEEADAVQIDLISKSLCAFFSGDPAKCARDAQGKITFQGDFCSTTKTAGGCADSMWLAATFAASSVKIFDGSGSVPECSGVSTQVDAGTDAAPDAAADAADAADGD
jgi:hypothetical protein